MSSHSSGHAHPHVLPLKIYLGIGAALLLLTFVTVEISLHDFGALNIIFALVIASIKALLVAFFFMHLWYDNKLFFICFTGGLLCLTVFIGLTMADTMRRGDIDPLIEHPINPRAEMYNSPIFTEGNSSGHGSSAEKSDSSHSGPVPTPADSLQMTPDSARSVPPSSSH